MTMHRLFNGRVKSYILVDVKTNSEESSCVKKLFLYGFSLSMLSHMNYVCIYSDNCLLSWAQILWHLHRAEVLWGHHHVVLTRVNSCCLFWLSLFRLNTLVALMMLFTVTEHKNIFSFFLSLSFNFSFTQHQHQLPHCHYLIVLFSLQNSYYNTYQKSDLYHDFCEFHMCLLCVILTLTLGSSSQWCLWLWETCCFI